MKINPCTIVDEVSGLKITFAEGQHQNRVRIERISEPIIGNRDFFFTKSGETDGASSCVNGHEKG